MSETATSHAQEHQNQVRGLVEDNLSADERHLVERRLLSCPACLKEYNSYSRIWASLTDRDQFRRWGRQLAAKDPRRHEVYRRAVDLVQEMAATDPLRTASASSGFWRSVVLWRNLAFASAAASVLIVSAVVHEFRKSAATRDEQLRAKVAETADLKARVDTLSTESAGRQTQLAELHQNLERHVRPRPNALLSIDFSATRRPGDLGVRSIQLPPDKTFLELRINTIEKRNYESYLTILRDNEGHPLWQSDGVAKNEEDVFSLTLGAGFLKPGDYEVLIYGQRQRIRELVAHVRFRITYGQ